MCSQCDQKNARRRLLERSLRNGSIVTADTLAGQFGVTTRTIYRDIRDLRRGGLRILGEAGVGYMLRRREVRHAD